MELNNLILKDKEGIFQKGRALINLTLYNSHDGNEITIKANILNEDIIELYNNRDNTGKTFTLSLKEE